MSLFDAGEHSARSEKLMATLDNINRLHGKKTIHYASETLSNRWHMRQQFKSQSYTTNWRELLTVKI